MKNKALLLTLICICITLSPGILNAQTLDMNACPIDKVKAQTGTESIHSSSDYSFNYSIPTWDSIRALTELNRPGQADAYPYISPDGLRLYISQNYELHSNLYTASRDDIHSLFDEPQLLSSNFPPGAFSCWLTYNELEIFYIYAFNLYHATRATITSPFSDPVEVDLGDNVQGFISGPTLTPDQQELYLFNMYGASWEDQLLIFNKSGPNTYTLVDTLEIPSGLDPGPGQLSIDGLKFYFSVEINNDSIKIARMERTDLSAPFENLEILDNNINSNLANGQPSVTADESILVFVRNDQNAWAANDLYMATNLSTGLIDSQDRVFDMINVFPNPCNDKIQINFILLDHAKVSFSICDISGRNLLSQEDIYDIGSHQTTMALDDLTEGMYLLNVEAGGKLRSYKIIKTD